MISAKNATRRRLRRESKLASGRQQRKSLSASTGRRREVVDTGMRLVCTMMRRARIRGTDTDMPTRRASGATITVGQLIIKSLRAVSKHFHYQRISKGHLLGNCRRGSKQFPGSCGGQTVTSLPPLAHHSPAAEQRMQQLTSAASWHCESGAAQPISARFA